MLRSDRGKGVDRGPLSGAFVGGVEGRGAGVPAPGGTIDFHTENCWPVSLAFAL